MASSRETPTWPWWELNSITTGMERLTAMRPATLLGTYTIRARTHQWHYTTRHSNSGPWMPITYTIVAPVNNPPSITQLSLGSDSGSSQTDGHTGNPMVSGTVLNDQPGRLVVEIDD